jgi:hypothetical protein
MIANILGSITLVGLGGLVYATWSAWRVRRARSPYSGACPCGCADAAILSQDLAANTQGRVKNSPKTPPQPPAQKQVPG